MLQQKVLKLNLSAAVTKKHLKTSRNINGSIFLNSWKNLQRNLSDLNSSLTLQYVPDFAYVNSKFKPQQAIKQKEKIYYVYREREIKKKRAIRTNQIPPIFRFYPSSFEAPSPQTTNAIFFFSTVKIKSISADSMSGSASAKLTKVSYYNSHSVAIFFKCATTCFNLHYS